MDLKKVVKVDNVIVGLSADNQEETLKLLVEPFLKEGAVLDQDVFLKDLLEREDQISTVIENGVAIPHARSLTVQRLSLSIGVANGDGIQFNPDSEIKCKLFFCIAIPVFAPTSHISLLQLLASFAHNLKRVEKIIQYKTAGGLSKALGAFKR